jgi:hypothetical protein
MHPTPQVWKLDRAPVKKKKVGEEAASYEAGWTMSTWPRDAHIEDIHEIQPDSVGKQWSIYLIINSLGRL